MYRAIELPRLSHACRLPILVASKALARIIGVAVRNWIAASILRLRPPSRSPPTPPGMGLSRCPSRLPAASRQRSAHAPSGQHQDLHRKGDPGRLQSARLVSGRACVDARHRCQRQKARGLRLCALPCHMGYGHPESSNIAGPPPPTSRSSSTNLRTATARACCLAAPTT